MTTSRQSLAAALVEIGFSIVGAETHGESALELAGVIVPEPGVACCGWRPGSGPRIAPENCSDVDPI